jgi:hypothetical protein
MESINFTEQQLKVVESVEKQEFQRGLHTGVFLSIIGLAIIATSVWIMGNIGHYFYGGEPQIFIEMLSE